MSVSTKQQRIAELAKQKPQVSFTSLNQYLDSKCLCANFIERRVTLDRSMCGTDQAASVEIVGMYRLVKDIRDIEKAMGSGVKRVYQSEMSAREKLRRQFLEEDYCPAWECT